MRLIFLDEINSTNTYSKEQVNELHDKDVVYTFKQTAGRGRFDRKWVDLGSGNIYLSIILKPSWDLKQVYSNLTQYTALKLAETFEKYNVIPQIKWPNDILIDEKKISGILAETVFKQNQLQGLIIGVGVNLNADENDFKKIDKKVTALNIETHKEINKIDFLNCFIDNFFANYENFLNNGFKSIKDEYMKRINFLNKEITIHNFNEDYTGIVEDISDEGSVIINNKEFYTGDIL